MLFAVATPIPMIDPVRAGTLMAVCVAKTNPKMRKSCLDRTLPPDAYFVQMLQQVSGVLINPVSPGALEFILAIAA